MYIYICKYIIYIYIQKENLKKYDEKNEIAIN